MKQKVSHVKSSEEFKYTDRDQVIYSDVMKIDKRMTLISVCDPLQLTLCTPVKDKSEYTLVTALQCQLQTVRERGSA